MANSFINKKADLTTTDLTTLYTVPSFKSAVVKSLLVSEDAGSGSKITITLVNASGTIFNSFIYHYRLPSGCMSNLKVPSFHS